jgi:cell division protein FtsW (lipid II flippase)
MREEEVSLLPKVIFLTVSFLVFFGSLFAMGNRHARERHSKYKRFCLQAALISAVFTVLILLLRREMMFNIALTVVFVFILFAMIYSYGKKMEGA